MKLERSLGETSALSLSRQDVRSLLHEVVSFKSMTRVPIARQLQSLICACREDPQVSEMRAFYTDFSNRLDVRSIVEGQTGLKRFFNAFLTREQKLLLSHLDCHAINRSPPGPDPFNEMKPVAEV